LLAEGAFWVGNDRVAPEDLAQALRSASGDDKETAVFLRADRQVPYHALMGILDELRSAGYLRVGLVGLDGGGKG
jgi:biopolymer transport protein ExbD